MVGVGRVEKNRSVFVETIPLFSFSDTYSLFVLFQSSIEEVLKIGANFSFNSRVAAGELGEKRKDSTSSSGIGCIFMGSSSTERGVSRRKYAGNPPNTLSQAYLVKVGLLGGFESHSFTKHQNHQFKNDLDSAISYLCDRLHSQPEFIAVLRFPFHQRLVKPLVVLLELL